MHMTSRFPPPQAGEEFLFHATEVHEDHLVAHGINAVNIRYIRPSSSSSIPSPSCTCVPIRVACAHTSNIACVMFTFCEVEQIFLNNACYTPGIGKIVPRNVI